MPILRHSTHLLAICLLLAFAPFLSCASTPPTPEEQLLADALKAAGGVAATVSALDLSGHDLTNLDFLPEMPALTKLDLSGNLLTSVDKLKEYPSIKELILSDNPLLENLDSLAGLHISILDISDNPHLADLTPLGECQLLKRLVIREYADYGDHIVPFLNSMPTMPMLKEFEFDESSEFTLDWAARCPKLEVIRCNQDEWNENYGSGLDLAPLIHLNDLKVLDLAGRNVLSLKPIAGALGLLDLSVTFGYETGDHDWSPLAKFSSLRRLRGAYLNSEELKYLSGMKQLESLSLSLEGGADLSHLPASAPLKELTLSLFMPRMDIYPEDWVPQPLTTNLDVLTRYPDLELLHLKNVAVDPASYAQFTSLKSLAFGGYKVELSPLSLPPGLESLTVHNADQAAVESIAQYGGLRSLTLDGADQFTGSSATDYTPLSKLTNLQSLSISIHALAGIGMSGDSNTIDLNNPENLPKIADLVRKRSIGQLDWVTPMTQLRHLSIGNPSPPIQESGPTSLMPLQQLTQLETLHLPGLYAVTDCDALAGCSNLRSLTLNGGVDSAGFLTSLSDLEALDLDLPTEVTDLSIFSELVSLQRLTLAHEIRDSGDTRPAVLDPIPLAVLQQLEELTLEFPITQLEFLRDLPRLRRLRIGWGTEETATLSPLVDNAGINRHDKIRVRIWNLTPELEQQLAALQHRGVEIETRWKH